MSTPDVDHKAEGSKPESAKPEGSKSVGSVNAEQKSASKSTSGAATPVLVKNVDEFTTALKKNESKCVVVDFFATWCGPCKTIAPKLQEFEKAYKNVRVVKVDVDEAEDVVNEYGISVVPTFMAFKGGKAVETLIGSDVDKIEDLFKKYN